MFKTLIFTLCLFTSSVTWSEVSIRWFSVASVLLEDGETRIFFDPMFTRATFWNWLGLSKLRSDEELVKASLKEAEINELNAVFSSHSHFDHVIDAPTIAKLTGATFYVDESSEVIARAYKDPLIKTTRIKVGEKITIGKFVITPMAGIHMGVRFLGGMDFLPGNVPADFNFSFWDYHLGESWFYHVEHPEGNILIDQGSTAFLEKTKEFKVDALVQGVANRKDDAAVINGYPSLFQLKVFVPVHFDDFVLGKPKVPSRLPGMKLEGLVDGLQKSRPQIKVVVPQYNQKIVLLEGK